jgi:hypothetical protein
MEIPPAVKAVPSRRKRRRGAVPARSGEPDLEFPPTPRREEHYQAHDHASKEEAAPAGIAVVSV